MIKDNMTLLLYYDETTTLIYNMINKYLNDKTLILVTHRPKLKDICNKKSFYLKR